MRIDLVLATRAAGRPRSTWAIDRPQRPQGQAAVRPRPGGRRLRRLTNGGALLASTAAVSGQCRRPGRRGRPSPPERRRGCQRPEPGLRRQLAGVARPGGGEPSQASSVQSCSGSRSSARAARARHTWSRTWRPATTPDPRVASATRTSAGGATAVVTARRTDQNGLRVRACRHGEGVGDHRRRRLGCTPRAGIAPLRPGAGAVRRCVRHEPGFHTGDDHPRPLPALRGVEGQQLDAHRSVGEDRTADSPAPSRRTPGHRPSALVQELVHGGGDARPAASSGGPSSSAGCERVVSPGAQPVRDPHARRSSAAAAGSRHEPFASHRHAGVGERPARQLCVRAGQHGDAPPRPSGPPARRRRRPRRPRPDIGGPPRPPPRDDDRSPSPTRAPRPRRRRRRSPGCSDS